MTLQTATNPNTGESVALVNGAWMPITQTATNAQGVKAYLVGGSWVVDDRAAPAPVTPATNIAPPEPAAATETKAPEQPQEKKKEEERHWYDFLTEEATARQKLGTKVGEDVFVATKNAPTALLGATAALAEGNDPNVVFGEKDWKDEAIKKARQQAKETAQMEGGEEEYALGIKRSTLRNLPNNLSYSLLSMGSGLAAGIPAFMGGSLATPVAGTVAGYGAGAAASGTAAYRMDTNGFLRDIREQLDAASEKVSGKPLTDEQFIKIAPKYESLVREHGLWEALPEALGNVLGAKLGGMIFKEAAPGIKGIITTTAQTGAEFVNELGTESVTQTGQHNTEVKAGLKDEPMRSFTSFEDMKKSAEEVLPDVLLMTGTMAGGAKAAGVAKRAIDTPERQFGRALQQDVDSRYFTQEGIERRAGQALDIGLTPEEVAGRQVGIPEPRVVQPEGEPTVQPAAEIAGAPVTEQPAAKPEVITEETISGLGVGKTNKSLREQILGKDLSDPAQVAEVRTALEAYAAKPKLSESIKEKVNAFLEQPELQPQPVETPNVITPVEAQQAEAQGAQQAPAAAPAIEPPVAQPEAALPTEQVTPAQPAQQFFNPLEADSYSEITDLLGLPEDATEAEVMDMADYMGHDAIVYNTPEGKKTLTVEEPGIDESQYMNVAPDRTGVNIPFTEPVQQQEARRTPSLKRTIDRLNKALESGQMTPEQHSQAVIDERELDKLRQSRKPVNPRARGARIIREKLLAAARRGEITEDEVDFAEWFVMQNPALVSDVGIGIRQAKEGNRGVAGFYNPLARIITLIKKSGSDKTVVHEILHHMERMMPVEVQDAIRGAWVKKLNTAKNKAQKGKDENLKQFFDLLTNYHFGSASGKDMQDALKMITDGKVDVSNYQFVNPSEFWAVNATDIMQNRYSFSDTVLNRLKNWLRELAQTIKGMFGLPSDAPIIKALNSLMKSDGKFKSNLMLGAGSEFLNISPNASQEAKAALTELNANKMGAKPEEPGLKERAKAAFRDAIDNPKLTAQSAKANTKRFLDKIETAAFSTDAAFNNDVRRSVMESTLNHEDKVGALLEISLSQTVHSDAVASNLLQYGEIKYNDELHKWEAIKNDNNFVSLTKQISDFAKKHNISSEEAQLIGHRAFEARRTKGLAKFAAEMKAEARSLFNQANKARLATAEANAAGDVEKATKLTEQSRKFAKEAQHYYNQAPTIHLEPDQVKLGMELFNKFPELNKIADTWMGMRENTKNALVESGLWSEEEAEKLLSNMDYVPFYREEQIAQHKGPKEFFRGLGVQAKEKRLKGSKKAVNNVFDNMARWMQHAAVRSVRNRSALALVDAAVENGMATKLDPKKKIKPTDAKNVVDVWRDGEKESYEMLDPMYMDAFVGLESVAIPMFKTMSAFSNMLRDTVVLNPLFTVAQIPQDSFSAMFTSGIKTRYALTIPARAAKEFALTLGKWSKTHEELRKFGAVGVKDFSSAVSRLDAEVTAGIKTPPGFWGKTKSVLSHIAMAGDNAVRQAVYEAADRSGLSKAEAIEKAFQIVNFRNKGSSKSLALAGQVIPFFNAYLAVQHVAYKTITGRGISPEERGAAFQTLLATTGAVYVLSTLYAMMNGDDDDYKNKPAAIRDRLLMIPGTGGLSIPLRKDWFLIPKVLAEHTYLLLADKGYEDSRKFKDSMKSTVMTALLSPTAVPQTIKPVAEIALNHDFFQDRELIPARMKSMETDRQFNNGTSELGKIFGKTGIMAPINFDHFVKGYFGSLGGLSLTLTNQVLHSNPDIPRPSMSFREILNSIPGTSGYISKPYESGLKNDFYVLVEECNKAANTMKDIENRSPSEIKEAIQDKTMVRRAGLAPELNKMTDELSDIRKSIDFITNAPESQLTADQKQEKIKKLKDVERKVLEKMNIKKLRELGQL